MACNRKLGHLQDMTEFKEYISFSKLGAKAKGQGYYGKWQDSMESDRKNGCGAKYCKWQENVACGRNR